MDNAARLADASVGIDFYGLEPKSYLVPGDSADRVRYIDELLLFGRELPHLPRYLRIF
jgi:hypothetical protein